MSSKAQESIERRVNLAINAAIEHHRYVSAIDVLIGMDLLTIEKVEAWRKGQVPYLERVVTAGLGTISRSMNFFRQQAIKSGLYPSETAYMSRGSGKRPLRFSKSGDPAIERSYRTHYVSRQLMDKLPIQSTNARKSESFGLAP